MDTLSSLKWLMTVFVGNSVHFGPEYTELPNVVLFV